MEASWKGLGLICHGKVPQESLLMTAMLPFLVLLASNVSSIQMARRLKGPKSLIG
jgi:hypothetical protein